MKSRHKGSICNSLLLLAGGVLTTGLTTSSFAYPVRAAQFNFSYSGTGTLSSGVFTTTDTPDMSGYRTITSMTGQRNGVAITILLTPGSFPDMVSNDNLLSTIQPFLTLGGFSYQAGAVSENVYYDQNSSTYFETDDPTGNANGIALNSFDLQRVPEPSFSLLDIGLGTVLSSGLVITRRIKKQKST